MTQFVSLSNYSGSDKKSGVMDIYPLGHSSFRIKGKVATVVTDPFSPTMVGLKFPKVEAADMVTVSHDHEDHNNTALVGGTPFIVTGPGEYEVAGVTVLGYPTFHDDKKGEERGRNTIYKMTVDGIRIVHLGDLGHKLPEEIVDKLGDVDILFVPVGGHYTIDAAGAAEVVSQIEPLVVIPMHYKREGMAKEFNEVEGVEKFLKLMGAEGVERINKYSVSRDRLPENTTVVVLE